MNLAFEHIVSREFWRRIYPANRVPHNPLTQIPKGDFVARRDELESFAPHWVCDTATLEKTGFRTHCLVFDRSMRVSYANHVSHAWTTKLPAESFYQLGEGVFVSSPEFSFLQLACVADIRELIAYGDEICGYYAFDQAAPRGFKTRTRPLTEKSRIADYLDNAEGCRGRKRAVRALRYVVDGSASPMETAIEMMNALPCKKLGGYGLPAPTMNKPIALDESAKRIARRNVCYADMCYPNVKLDIEYHGRFDHDDKNSFDSDRARVNGLIEMGFEVIEITYQQLSDFKGYEAIVRHIGRRLGKPVRSENLGFLDERVKLREVLREWNRSGGVPRCVRQNASVNANP